MIFEKNQPNRRANGFCLPLDETPLHLPNEQLRAEEPLLPELSELEVVRHFTRLSQQNYSIDTQFYPLGSCSMKYNPRIAHQVAMMPGYLNVHPYADETTCQGLLQTMYELQAFLREVTGMQAVSLAPMAGAQGELAGVMMIRAYHQARNEVLRTEILVPDCAHGTNPASAAQCGFTVREIPTTPQGDVDLAALQQAVGPRTAGIMLTNPSTLGVFEREIKTIADLVHGAGGLLYYDGANLNAILGRFRPGDMGFDVMHLNLHKTFATPHGGGGPGSGPVAANARLAKFLPLPQIIQEADHYRLLNEEDRPHSIGRVSTFHGNFGVLLRAYVYARMLGKQGLRRVSAFATLNANYLMHRLQAVGYTLAYPGRRASHEFLITVKDLKAAHGITALDVAKRLLDYGIHAPTVYFPLLVPECLLIEPTETESRETLDLFVDAMAAILHEAKTNPAQLREAPHTTPVRRLDEVAAARQLEVTFRR